MNALTKTDFKFEGQRNVYHGKFNSNGRNRPYFSLRCGIA